MKSYIKASFNFWALVFTSDFFESIGSNLALLYRIQDTDNGGSIAASTIILVSFAQPKYTTYPTFIINTYCSSTQKGPFPCVAITGTCDSTANFCLDNGFYFWCGAVNKYMNMATSTCSTSCPAFYTRLPDSVDSSAYCLWNCATSQNAICPNTGNIIVANYNKQSSFNCNTSFSRISYNCLYTSNAINSKNYCVK